MILQLTQGKQTFIDDRFAEAANFKWYEPGRYVGTFQLDEVCNFVFHVFEAAT